PRDAEVRIFLENLAIDSLIALAGDSGRELLRGLTLFNLPVPETVAGKLAGTICGSLSHLRDLGLVDVHEDIVDHEQRAIAPNALAAARVEQLSDDERRHLASDMAHELFAAWGGAAAEPSWPDICDLELAELGLLAEDGEAVAACATAAVRALLEGPA